MASSMKSTQNDTVKCKSENDTVKCKSSMSPTTPTATRDPKANKSSLSMSKSENAPPDKRGPAKSKPVCRSTSSPLMKSASSAYAPKEQAVSSLSRSQRPKSKQQTASSSRGKLSRSTSESKQTSSPQSKQRITRNSGGSRSKETEPHKDVEKRPATDNKQTTPEREHDDTSQPKPEQPITINKSDEADVDDNTNEQANAEEKIQNGPDVKEQLDSGESTVTGNNRRLLDIVRERCLSKGRQGIHGLGLLFRHLDVDYNKRIVFDELKEKLNDFGIQMSDNNLRALFGMLDADKSGGIDFLEMMTSLRPPMKESRQRVIDEAFNKVDTNGNGFIDQEEIRGGCPF